MLLPAALTVVETALAVRNLKKVYGRREILRSVSLDIAEGQIFGLLGPNGAGKTTLLRTIVGLTRASAGTIQVLGIPVPERLAEVLPRVGASIGEMDWYGQLSGHSNLRLLSFAAHRPLSHSMLSDLLQRVGLGDARRTRTKHYSTGMSQRLGIASALAGNPELVILDEPTAGLDPYGVRRVRDLVVSLRDRGITVVLSSHQLSEVELVCDAVAILDVGRVVASGPVSELLDRHASVPVTGPIPPRPTLEQLFFELTRSSPRDQL